MISSDYTDAAIAQAEYCMLENGTYCGHIPICPGVIAFADTVAACRAELRSVLEDWIFVGLMFEHPLPTIK